jgi:hypothetical protein
MRVRRGPARAAFVAAVVVGLVVPAGAASGHDEEAPVDRVDSQTGFAHDVGLIAARTGWTPAATADHMRVQQRLGALLGRLAQRHPATFAGGRLAAEPGGTSVVRFTGAVPPDAAADAAAAGIRVDVVGGAKYSSAEQRARVDAIVAHLRGTGHVDAAASALFDGSIEVVVGGGGLPPQLPANLRDDVRVTMTPGAVSRTEHSLGGARLRDGGAFQCTSGFTVVENATGITGVSTAGHCTGIDQYDPPGPEAPYAVTFEAEHVGSYGDFQWMTSSHLEPAQFYATDTQVRVLQSITPYVNLAVGATYCVYGRASNSRACDTVYSTYTSTTTIGSLVTMTADNTINGDSGGTWAFNNEGIGIHCGDLYTGGSWRNVYSLAANMYTALGVTPIY